MALNVPFAPFKGHFDTNTPAVVIYDGGSLKVPRDGSPAFLQHTQKQTFKEQPLTKMRTVDAAVAIIKRMAPSSGSGVNVRRLSVSEVA
ncbi:hypothetical protein [Arthrobacter sp. UYEF20]|uniref:hypothetical protein n=1 Tax=Arthrobacter sp. UYEF20 TaxID=1756363 RepID=UPI003399DFE8